MNAEDYRIELDGEKSPAPEDAAQVDPNMDKVRHLPWAKAERQRAANDEANTVTELVRTEVQNLMRAPNAQVDVHLDGPVLDFDQVIRRLERCRVECALHDGVLSVYFHDLSDKEGAMKILKQMATNDGFVVGEVFAA